MVNKQIHIHTFIFLYLEDEVEGVKKYVRTTKGKSTHKLACGKLYSYYPKHIKTNREHWKCDAKGCGATIIHKTDTNKYYRTKGCWNKQGFHLNHLPNTAK